MRIAVVRCSMMMALLTVLLFAGTGADAGTWSRETVDDTTRCYYYETSLALDDSWTPHVSYYDSEGYRIRYAQRTASGWDTTTVASGVSSHSLQALALDSLGRPRICYAFSENNLSQGLMYAEWNGTSWVQRQIGYGDPWGIEDVSLAVDSNGYSHAVWSRDNRLYHSRGSGQLWGGQEVIYGNDSGDSVFDCSLACDTVGGMHVSFTVGGHLHYGVRPSLYSLFTSARVDCPTWITNVSQPSLALKADGTPGISYRQYKDGVCNLMFVESDGSNELYPNWDVTAVEQTSSWSSSFDTNSLAYDSMGLPHIAHFSPNNTDLRYCAYDGSSWNTEVADTSIYPSRDISMALDPEGTAHIAWVRGLDLCYTKDGPGVPPQPGEDDVPEPATFVLLLATVPVIGALRRRKA